MSLSPGRHGGVRSWEMEGLGNGVGELNTHGYAVFICSFEYIINHGCS